MSKDKSYRYTNDNADATPFDTYEEAEAFAKRIPAIDEPQVEALWDGYVIVCDRGGFCWVRTLEHDGLDGVR